MQISISGSISELIPKHMQVKHRNVQATIAKLSPSAMMHSLREETTRPVSLKDWRTSAFYPLHGGETQTFAGN